MIDYRTRSEAICTRESGAFVHNFNLDVGSFHSNETSTQNSNLQAASPLKSVWRSAFGRARSPRLSFVHDNLQGKIRRFVNTNFRKQETIASLALRRGECNRCGACCELVFKCPFLKKNPDGTSLCGIYENRPNSCRLFPIEQRDIREVKGTCSYYFVDKPMRLGKAS